MKFELVEVVPESPTLAMELEFVRMLRNSVRDKMTGNSNLISSSEQITWFKTLNHESLKLFLFIINNEAAGYGIIRYAEDSYPWLTGVLLEEFRGSGYGKVLFEMLTDTALESSREVYLNAFESNVNAVGMYHSIGYVPIEKRNGIITMMYHRVDE